MSFKYLIGRVLSDDDTERAVSYLQKIGAYQRYLSHTQRDALKFTVDFYNKYAALPSAKVYESEMHLKHEVSMLFAKEPYDYLWTLFIQSLRAGHMRRITNKVESMENSREYSFSELLSLIESMPRDDQGSSPTALDEFVEIKDNLFAGIEKGVGFKLGLGQAIDEEIGLLRGGRMFGLVAHQKGGKTTILANVCIKGFISGLKVLLCTYEITRQEMYKKLFAVLGEYNTKIYNAEVGTPEYDKLQEKKEIVEGRLKSFSDAYGGSITIEQGATVNRINVMQKEELERTGRPYDLVLLDNIYLLPADDGQDTNLASWQNIEHNIQKLRTSCVGNEQEGIPPYAIFFTSQLDPKAEGLTASDVAKSRSLGETADAILSVVPDASNPPNGRMVYVLANRNGSESVNSTIKFDFSKTGVIVDASNMGAMHSMVTIVPPPVTISLASLSIVDDEEDAVTAPSVPTGTKKIIIAGVNDEETDGVITGSLDDLDTVTDTPKSVLPLKADVDIETEVRREIKDRKRKELMTLVDESGKHKYQFGDKILAPYNDPDLFAYFTEEEFRMWEAILQICGYNENEIAGHFELFSPALERRELAEQEA